MNFKLAFFSCIVMLCVVQLKAQTLPNQVIEQMIESITENTTEDFDYSELVDRLNHYSKHPLNLNKASAEQLQELGFLSPVQINALLNYRDLNGSFMEFFELQAISVLGAETIRKLVPFCTLTEVSPFENLRLKDLVRKGSAEVMFTYAQVLQRQRGYMDPQHLDAAHYVGSPQRFLSRYKYRYGQTFSASLTMEKDAGEPFFSDGQKRGFDFYSGNLSYTGKGSLRKVIVGDYSLQFGQGLSMWSGLSFGKGAAVATITKNNLGLKPYTSTNELLFLRGVSATINVKSFDITPFASIRRLDGSIEAADGREKISSLQTSGFHRTPNERKGQGDIRQLVYGGNLQYTKRRLRLGATAYETRFNHEFEPNKLPYNVHDFAGDRLVNTALYYNYNWRNLYMFGEAAHSLSSGFAYLNGAMASLSPKVSLILFHRNYHKNYHSFFNQAVAEGTNAANEKGFYSGLVLSPNRKTEFNFYADFFKFPWLRFRVDAPSSGYELLSQFSYSPSKKMNLTLRYKFEQKEENTSDESTINHLTEVRKQNYRFEINYRLSKALQMRNRVEMVDYSKAAASEQGFLMYQDIIFKPMTSRFSGNCRFALFDTPGFSSRLYAFENDVLYSYSVPAYHNKGMRFYANGRWRINRATDVWLRYAITSYTNLKSVGSGPEMIEGNKKSDFKLQVRFQF